MSSYIGRKRDNIWSYFTQISGGFKSKRAVCKRCKIEMSALVCRMKDHILNKCVQDVENEDISMALSTSDEEQFDSSNICSHQEVLNTINSTQTEQCSTDLILNQSLKLYDYKKRWKNMKDTYNKNKRSRKLGTGSSTKNKQTKWALADALSFVDVCSYERTGLTNFNSTNEMKNSEEEDSLTVTVDDANNSSNFSSISATENTTVQENELENNLNTDKTKLLEEKRFTKKVKQNEELLSSLKRSNNERQQILNSIINSEEDDDPIDAFFKTMALTVKTFPQHLKIKAKKEVFNIITNLEIENL